MVQAKDKVDQCYDDAPIFSNLPPAAGAIYWARCSRHRINEPMNKLAFYNLALRETPEEFREVKKQHQTLDKMLQDYELQRYQTWEQTSVEAAKEKLKMRLLRRQEKSGLLKVNFDPALVRLLREVRFFLIFDIEVPPVPRPTQDTLSWGLSTGMLCHALPIPGLSPQRQLWKCSTAWPRIDSGSHRWTTSWACSLGAQVSPLDRLNGSHRISS